MSVFSLYPSFDCPSVEREMTIGRTFERIHNAIKSKERISPNRRNILLEIDDIERLPDRWNGEDSYRISHEIAEKARRIIKQCTEAQLTFLNIDSISPHENGTISLNFKNGRAIVIFHIGEDSSTVFLKNDYLKEGIDEAIIDELPIQEMLQILY